LGETYVELTPGTRHAKFLKEGGQLSNGQVQPTVELDELLQAFDPGTRQAFHIWQQELAKTITTRGQDFSDAIGNLPAFSTDASALLKVLYDQSSDLTKLVRNTGTVFRGALAQLRPAAQPHHQLRSHVQRHRRAERRRSPPPSRSSRPSSASRG